MFPVAQQCGKANQCGSATTLLIKKFTTIRSLYGTATAVPIKHHIKTAEKLFPKAENGREKERKMKSCREKKVFSIFFLLGIIYWLKPNRRP